MARVTVNPKVIQWALNRTKKVEIIMERFPKLNAWINDKTRPTLKQLEQFANATSTPLGYFFLPEPPQLQLPIPHYRTLDDTRKSEPSPDLLDTVQMMQRRQTWMREYVLDMGQEPLSFVGSYQMTDDPKEVARNIREILKIESGWAAECRNWQDALKMLINKVENIGVMVIRNGIVGNNTRRKLDVNEFRGFVLIDDFVPLIFINGADGKAAQMFTIAHELAHIWFGESAAFDLSLLQPANIEIERICNQTAAEFLVPEDELRTVWGSIQRDPERFNLLAKHFKVSSIVIARRTLDLMLISKDEFFNFYNNWFEMERKQSQEVEDGGNFYLNLNYRIGRRFAEAVFTSVKEGRLHYNEAYRLTGLKGKTFSEYAKRLGIGVSS